MIRNTLIAAFILLISSSLFAGEVSLKQALTMAEKNNKNLKLAQAEKRMADARVKEAWSSALPTLSSDINYTRNLKSQYFYINTGGSGGGFGGPGSPSRFSFTFKNDYNITAKLDQTIYSFGKVGTALKIAYEYEDFVQANYDFQSHSILAGVKQAFYGVVVLQKIYRLAVGSEKNAHDNYLQTKERYQNGAVSEYDLLQAEVRWRDALPQKISAQKDYELAMNNFKIMLDIPVTDSLSLKGNLNVLPALPAPQILDSVLTVRQDLKAMKLEYAMRKKNVSLEFANHLPNLTGNFTYNYSGRSDLFKIENDNAYYTVGVRLHIPIFSGGFTSAQVQKAEVDAYKSQIQLQEKQQQVGAELINARLRLNEAHTRINGAAKNVDVAQRAFEIAQTRVANGLSTQLELRDSRLLLDRAQVNDLSARYDYIKAYLNWQKVTGRWNDGL